MSKCLICPRDVVRKNIGRSPVYCSNACKMIAYRRRLALRIVGSFVQGGI